ncbi:hypothetical protein CDAR_294901 [Caerostris darwini]|uniref:Uncharacterized protein n=1 Tax=Caerostris darwini TaxID=1538125 RepID=A0AAV4UKS5_9ARAC|nr:hypothetical protein CDAR_294901 [Caerostris darwini]
MLVLAFYCSHVSADSLESAVSGQILKLIVDSLTYYQYIAIEASEETSYSQHRNKFFPDSEMHLWRGKKKKCTVSKMLHQPRITELAIWRQAARKLHAGVLSRELSDREGSPRPSAACLASSTLELLQCYAEAQQRPSPAMDYQEPIIY